MAKKEKEVEVVKSTIEEARLAALKILQEAYDAAVAAAVASDPTLQDDYDKRDALLESIKAENKMLGECFNRIALKEGKDLVIARDRLEHAVMTDDEWLQVRQRPGQQVRR